jgi:hypothetical protein
MFAEQAARNAIKKLAGMPFGQYCGAVKMAKAGLEIDRFVIAALAVFIFMIRHGLALSSGSYR